MVPKSKMLSATASGSSRTIDELDGDRCIAMLLRARRAVGGRSTGGASLRGQTAAGWRGLGPIDQEKRTRRAPLRGHVLVDSYSSSPSVTLGNTWYKIPRQVDSINSALGAPLHRQTKGSQR